MKVFREGPTRPRCLLADDRIRVGVVGLGSFGSHHARHHAAHPRTELVALSDADPARAGAAVERHGGAAFADYRDLVGLVDAVSVTVPASLHHAVAGFFLDTGVHVLVEKPIAASVDEARDLVARAARSGAVLQVGMLERFSPVVAALSDRLVNPRRLTFRRMSIWNGRATDVDVVLDMMIHDIDLALVLAGTPVKAVAASGAVVRSDFTDEAEAWITFANGAVATLSASRVATVGERIVSITEPGTSWRGDLGAQTLMAASRSRYGMGAEAVDITPGDNLGAEIDAFITSVAARAPALVDGEAGVAALEIAERIRAAIAEGEALDTRSIPE